MKVRGYKHTFTAADESAGEIDLELEDVGATVVALIEIRRSGAAIAWDGAYSLNSAGTLINIDNSGSTDFEEDDELVLLVF